MAPNRTQFQRMMWPRFEASLRHAIAKDDIDWCIAHGLAMRFQAQVMLYEEG